MLFHTDALKQTSLILKRDLDNSSHQNGPDIKDVVAFHLELV